MVRSGLLRARLRRRTACGKSARAGQVGSERADGDRAGPMRARRGLLVRARRWARWLPTCCARRAAQRRARRRVRVSGCARGHAAHHWRAPSRARRGGGRSGSSGGWRRRWRGRWRQQSSSLRSRQPEDDVEQGAGCMGVLSRLQGWASPLGRCCESSAAPARERPPRKLRKFEIESSFLELRPQRCVRPPRARPVATFARMKWR